jgi:hypothetical protein
MEGAADFGKDGGLRAPEDEMRSFHSTTWTRPFWEISNCETFLRLLFSSGVFGVRDDILLLLQTPIICFPFLFLFLLSP